ncbi:hypothetical protein ABT173_12480 [Streptomyces sp. NPDC001795]|uniref:hypothetical protein n=1 Tax=unclassified Streptomyces TaxID=2593676 RepID=UPI0033190FD6
MAAASELVADGARVVVSGRSEKSVAVSAAQSVYRAVVHAGASRERRARWAASTRPYQSFCLSMPGAIDQPAEQQLTVELGRFDIGVVQNHSLLNGVRVIA